jgi:four helix bundle protein
MSRFRSSQTYIKAMNLVKAVYRASETMPTEERYVLTSQMRRAALSVPINLCEGFGRDTTKELLRNTSIARGSLMELEALVDIATDLGVLRDGQEIMSLCDECSRMLTATRKTLMAKTAR